MPEGPEVLTIVDQLDFYLVHKVVESFEFISGKYEDDYITGFNDFKNSLPLTIQRVFCKGKLIVFELIGKDQPCVGPPCVGKKWWIFNSLRMTGTWGFTYDKNYSRCKINLLPREENGVLDITEILRIRETWVHLILYVKNLTKIFD